MLRICRNCCKKLMLIEFCTAEIKQITVIRLITISIIISNAFLLKTIHMMIRNYPRRKY